MPDAHLETLALEILERTMRDHPLPYTPKIVWKNYRVTAGMAYYKIGVIGLSRLVLDTPERLTHTLLHEYAHLLAVARHGPKAAGHGKHWVAAMRELGLEPAVRHRYEVTRNRVRQRVTYKCLGCQKLIHRARRLPRRRHYVHAGCGGSLRLMKIERITASADDA